MKPVIPVVLAAVAGSPSLESAYTQIQALGTATIAERAAAKRAYAECENLFRSLAGQPDPLQGFITPGLRMRIFALIRPEEPASPLENPRHVPAGSLYLAEEAADAPRTTSLFLQTVLRSAKRELEVLRADLAKADAGHPALARLDALIVSL